MTRKVLSRLSLLAVLAALAPITGHDAWLAFLAFLPFAQFAKAVKDERYIINRDKAARNGFIASIAGIFALIIVLIFHPSFEIIIHTITAILFGMGLTFSLSFRYYDKRGM